MAQSVDTKIVELKFNNDNFADKVDSTLTKLEQLNKSIQEDGLTNALKNLGKTAKDVDFSGITKGVEETSKGFSKMEVFAVTAMANISNSVVNLGKRMAKSLVNPLTQGVLQGGLARARNIEQATFQFEGQKIGKSKGNENLSYYKEVMDAVLGTSYSYDVAAKAASQLAASNIGVIETERKLADGTTITAKAMDSGMTKALLGIAGVASMTGSDFDSIAQIFTRVAGQGKVMAMDLNSIAVRGLNAAAVLATSLGKTEAEVRDMVSKGKISFDDFSKAMSDAFGAHAKDSTLMFQGALDDVNAALARIGADFYGPALKAGRDILNSVTPLVDAIHNKLNKALTASGNIMDTASKKLSQYLDMLSYIVERFPNDADSMGDWINEHMNAWTNIADLYKRGDITSAIDGLDAYMSKVKSMKGEGIDGWKMLADYLNLTTDETKKLAKEGKVGFNDFIKSFHQLWSQSDKLMAIPNITDEFNKYVQACIGAAAPTETFNRHVSTMFSIFAGAKSLMDSTVKIFSGLASIFLTLAQHLAPLGKLFVDLAATIADFVVKVADSIATSKHFTTIIDSLVSMLTKLFELLHLNKIAGAVLLGITKAFDFLATAIDRVYAGIAKVFSVFQRIFNSLIDKIWEVVTNTELLNDIFHKFAKAGIIVGLINFARYLTKPAELLDNLGLAIKNVGDSFTGLVKGISGVFSSIAGMIGKIGKVIDEVTNTLKRMQELIVATAILEIAFAIAVLAGSLYLLSKVNVKSAADALVPLADYIVIVGSLFSMMMYIAKNSKQLKDIDKVAHAFLEFAGALAILAAAVYALSTIDGAALMRATAAVEVLMFSLAAIARILSPKETKSTGLKALWSGEKTSHQMIKGIGGIIALAMAVKMVSKALVGIAQIEDPDRLYDALIVIETVMWSMAAITKWLSGDKAAKMTKGAMTLIAMAVAIRLLAKPIQELASLDTDQMWNATIMIGGLMTVMSALLKWLSGSEGLVKAGIGFILLAASIKILQDTVLAFAALNPDELWNSFIIIAASLAAMTLALNQLDTDGLLSKSIAFLAVAYALKQVSDVVMTFGANSDQAWNGILAAGVALGVLAGACALFKKVPIGGILKLFLTLELGAVAVATFGAAIGVFGIGLTIFGVGLSALVSGVTQLTGVMGPFLAIVTIFGVAITVLTTIGLPAVGVILALSLAFLALGAGMNLMGNGLEKMATAIEIMNELKGELGDTAKGITDFVGDLSKLKKEASSIGESFETIAAPMRSLRKSISMVSEDVEKLLENYKKIEEGTTDNLNSLATSLTTISKFSSDSFTAASEALSGFIANLKSISGDVSSVTTSIDTIKTNIALLKASIDEVVVSIDGFKKHEVVFSTMGTSIQSIATPLQTLSDLRTQFVNMSTDIQTFIDSLANMQVRAGDISEGSAAITGALNEMGQAVSQVSNYFNTFNSSMGSTFTSIGNGLTQMANGVSKITKVSDKVPAAANAIKSFYTKLEKLTATAGSVSKSTDKVAKAVEKLGKAAKNAIKSKDMVDSGKELVNGLIKGIDAKGKNVKTKSETIVRQAEAAIKTHRSDFYDIGSYLIAGMVSGIASQQSALESQVRSLESKAERAVRAKAKIKSPSRVWMQIGAYMGEGLAIGIKNSGDQVVDASKGLASVSEDAINAAIRSISNSMESDWDMNPKITPVVDLTNIDRSASKINSAFGKTNLGIGASSSLARSITGIQNGSNYNAINNLAKKIDSMTETMNSRSLNNYITIDGASDPDAFADDLIRNFRLNARTM